MKELRECMVDQIKEYVEEQTFEGVKFDSPEEIKIDGGQFTVAKISHYAECKSYSAMVKFIKEKGGIVKDEAVKSADYVIVTPVSTRSENSTMVYVKEKEKYEKAVSYNLKTGKPLIIRDIDFYIINNMFSKLDINDKRRVVLEYVKGENICFNEKNSKPVQSFIKNKARDDMYFQTKSEIMALANESVKENLQEDIELLDENTGTLKEWRKYFSFSEETYRGKTTLILKKCKMLTETVRVPAVIEGMPVTKVEMNAFKNLNGFVKEVILPHTVTCIRKYSFNNCEGIERIVIENKKCEIDRYSFCCPTIKEIIINGKNVAAKEDDELYKDYVFVKK